jgi:hypothetical protein
MQNIPHIQMNVEKFYKTLSVPQNIVMDLNDVMKVLESTKLFIKDLKLPN